MIVWINGAFGGGKTTLAQELHSRLPDALPFDPEYVGAILAKWAPPAPSGDFQDIPLWRNMVAQFAIGLAADYDRTLIVPMTLVHPHYRNEIFALIKASGQLLLHVFLDVPAEELKRRINTRTLVDDDPAADAEAREFRLGNVDRCVAARDGLPADTLVLRGDQHTPSELADLVLAHGASALLSSMGETAEGVGVGSCPAAVRVVATTMLKADARAKLSEQLGPGFVVVDLRKAPPLTDIVIAPVVSGQTISALKHLFPKARVVLTEVEDRDAGVFFSGPVRRAVEAGADGYVVAGDLAALAEFAVSDARLALNPGQAGQLDAASVRTPSTDEAVMSELASARSHRRELQ